MPRNTTWFRRKYIVENTKAKNLCKIYKIQLLQNSSNQQNGVNRSECLENTNKTIRVDKNVSKYQIPVWAQVNQREEYGYTIIPESPVSYFNQHEQNDFGSYEKESNGKYYNWEHVDTNEDWIQYQY